jgi:hypothetical protein
VQVTAARIVCSYVKGEMCKSFVVYKLTGMGGLPYVAKQPHFVAGCTVAWANLFRQL